MKMISCGIIILNNENKILLGHVTGQKHWDVPKGLKNENEEYIDTAIRETKEETGLNIIRNDLKYIDYFIYNKKKDLVLYRYKIENIDISILKCNSLFKNRYTKEMIPEIDDFKLFSLEEALNLVCESMKKVLIQIKF